MFGLVESDLIISTCSYLFVRNMKEGSVIHTTKEIEISEGSELNCLTYA
jgi:hypothetical protein